MDSSDLDPPLVEVNEVGVAGSITMTPESLFATASLERHDVADATLAVRRFGSGPALVLIHGFPVHGYTWRALLPALAEHHTCFVLDLPGLGDSGWTDATDFSFTGQARRVAALLPRLDAHA